MADLDTQELAWCNCDGQFVFLDLAADRYFRLSPSRNRDFYLQWHDEVGSGWHQPPALPRPSDWVLPRRTSGAIGEGAFRLQGVAAAIWTQRRVERRLADRRFREVLLELRTILTESRRSLVAPDVDRVIRSFEQARLLRTAADRCLPRSIALSLRLAALGVRTHVVLGVRLEPFAAHCWTQQHDVVLNDSIEEVQRYAPILVI